jgi:hypothetical protein
MTYEKPEIHEIGLAEDVVQGVDGEGSDIKGLFPPAFTLEDFEE